MTYAPADEGRHPPGDQTWWAEGWTFTFHEPAAGVGGYVGVVLLPGQQRAWYWCALVRPGAPLLSVVDLDQTVPLQGLRLRRGSLWADHTCEAPFEQWTVGNETYAVALDDPEEALRQARGDAVPVAFDLEWYAEGPATPLGEGGIEGYEQPGEVRGGIELKGGGLEVTGPGHRTHWWGVRDWFGTGFGVPAEGVRAPVLLTSGDGRAAALEHVLTPTGWRTWCRPR